MHAVVRRYTGPGASDLFHLLEKRKGEVEDIIRTVPGLVSYTLVRDEEGGASITVCEDRTGCEASMKAARDWIAAHAKGLGLMPPDVTDGTAILHLD